MGCTGWGEDKGGGVNFTPGCRVHPLCLSSALFLGVCITSLGLFSLNLLSSFCLSPPRHLQTILPRSFPPFLQPINFMVTTNTGTHHGWEALHHGDSPQRGSA